MIGEGILDSILPFICAANLPVQKPNVNHVCGLKAKINGTIKIPSPRINANASDNTNKNGNESITDRHPRRKSNHSIGLLSE